MGIFLRDDISLNMTFQPPAACHVGDKVTPSHPTLDLTGHFCN